MVRDWFENTKNLKIDVLIKSISLLLLINQIILKFIIFELVIYTEELLFYLLILIKQN
jgi:hypothetical protein